MPGALDMALDDVITSATGGRKGGGKSGRKGGGKIGGGKGKRREQTASDFKVGGDKLDKSLDDIVETTRVPKGKGRKGSGKSNGLSWGSGKGGGKSGGKGAGFRIWGGAGKGLGRKGLGRKGGDFGDRFDDRFGGAASYRPAWMEHDEDRLGGGGAFGMSAGGSGKGIGRRGRGNYESLGDHDDRVPGPARMSQRELESFPMTHPLRRAARNNGVSKATRSSGGFLTIDQDDDDDEPPRRRPSGVSRLASGRALAGAAAAAKRNRARDDDDDDRRPRAKVAKTAKSGTKVVKVTNVPKELKARDVREAFEGETGKILSCELGKGTAIITFSNSGDARKAVEAFHKGELNGKIISVVLAD